MGNVALDHWSTSSIANMFDGPLDTNSLMGNGVDWGVDGGGNLLDGVGLGLVDKGLGDLLDGSHGSSKNLTSEGGDVLEDGLSNMLAMLLVLQWSRATLPMDTLLPQLPLLDTLLLPCRCWICCGPFCRCWICWCPCGRCFLLRNQIFSFKRIYRDIRVDCPPCAVSDFS